MSDKIEIQARTVDEAVSEALLKMGARRDEVDITVLEEPKSGFLGILGGRPARVIVRKRQARRRSGGRDYREGAGSGHQLSDKSRGDGRGSRRGGRRSGARTAGGQAPAEGNRGGRPARQENNERSAREGGGSSGGTQERQERKPGEERSPSRRSRGRRGGRGRRDDRRDRDERQTTQGSERQTAAGNERQPEPGNDRNGRGEGQDRNQRRDRNDNQAARGNDGRSRRGGRGGRGGGRQDRDGGRQDRDGGRQGRDGGRQGRDGGRQDRDGGRQGRDGGRQDRDERQAPQEVAAAPRPEPRPENGLSREERSRSRSRRTPRDGESHPAARAETSAPAPVEEQETRQPAVAAVDSGPDEEIVSGVKILQYAKPTRDVGAADIDDTLAELANGLLVRAGFPVRCEVKPGEYRLVKIVTDDSSAGMLIGRYGQTVDAVEHLVERMMQMAAGDRVPMNLDINNYRRRREEALVAQVADMVARVRSNAEDVHLEPMSARERRICHLEAEKAEGIATWTVGGHGGKHVVIGIDDGVDRRDPADVADEAATDEAADVEVEIVASEEPMVEVVEEQPEPTIEVSVGIDVEVGTPVEEPVEAAEVEDDPAEPRRDEI